MLVKVYIKRHIKEGKDAEALELLKKLRINAMNQEGYISGETLVNSENPQLMMVASTWQDMASWDQWKKNPQRDEIDKLLAALQVEPTSYEAFVFSKYRVYVKKGFPDPPSSPM